MTLPAVGKAQRVHPWPDLDAAAKTAYMTRVRDEPEQKARPAGPAWPLIALPVTLLTAGIAAVGSTGRQMWIDEYATFHAVSLSWSEFLRLMGNEDLVHGLYYVLMRVWTTAFGTSLLSLRLPSIIGMAVAAGALTLLGRRLYGTSVGLTAGILFALIPAVSRYGQEAGSYAWVVALAVLSTLVLTYALEKPTWWRWTVYTGLTVTLTYLHFVAALVMLAHALMARHAIRRDGDGKALRWLVVAAVVGLAAAPLLYEASTQSGQRSWIEADLAAVQRYPTELFTSQIVVWMIALLAVAGAMSLPAEHRGAVLPVVVWAVAPPVLSYVSHPVVHLFLAKYSLFTLPAYALLAAGAIAVPGRDAARQLALPKAVGIVAAAALVVVAGLGAHRDVRRDPTSGEPDFRAAAAVVDAAYQPGDGIAYAGVERKARLPFTYELTAKPTDVFATATAAELGRFAPGECTEPAKCVGETSRLWLVSSNYSNDRFAGLPAAQADLLRKGFKLTKTDAFSGVRVHLLVRTPAG